MRLGVFLPSWIGDTCMATPTLRALRSGLPSDTEIIGISRPGPAALLHGTLLIDEFIKYNSQSCDRKQNRWALIDRLKKADLDAVLLLTNSLSSAAVAWAAGIPRRIGYAKDCRGLLLSDRVKAAEDHQSSGDSSLIESYLHLAQRIGCEPAGKHMELTVDPADTIRATKILELNGFRQDRPLIVINNSAASAKSRCWPQQYLVYLCQQLLDDSNAQILLHAGPNDREQANAVCELVNSADVQSMGLWHDLPLGLSKAIIEKATMVVTSDSGPRHIAVALNRPVISLFGSTAPQATQTYNINETILESFQECRPCYKAECPMRHHRCMREISVDQVQSAILALLTRQTPLRLAS